jgi:Tfp pilus assembly protein PilE
LYFLKESGHLMKLSLENDKVFRLVEILAVLLIPGILAAVAMSKYLDVTEAGRKATAQGAIAEVKGRLSAAQAKLHMMNNSGTPCTSVVGTFVGVGDL